MYQAFVPALLLDKLPVKIESLAFHRQNLYVGTASGVLLLYRISPVSEGATYVDEFGEGYGIELTRSIKQFSKRAIERLEVIPELGLLIALTDNQVNAYDLSSLQFQVALAPPHIASKAPLLTAVTTGIAQLAPRALGQDEAGPPPQATPTLTTRIGIAGKRSLVMLTWVDGEFASDRTQEFTIPDKVRCLEFLTADQLWMGTSTKEYWILRLDTGVIIEAAPSTNLTATTTTDETNPPLTPTSKGAAAGVSSTLFDLAYSSTQYVSSYNPLNLRSAQPRPLMLKVSAQEMIIVKGEVGLFVGLDGTTSRRSAIHFPLEPLFLGYSFPYLIIGSSKQIEIRNLDSQATIQNSPLTPIALTQGKAPYIATSNQIWRWVPSHFADQINKLIELKLFEEALTLLEQNRDRVSEVQTCTAHQIRELYALELFLQGQFDRALGMALELLLSPRQIIGLYPPVITGESFSDSTSDSKSGGNEPYHHLKDPNQWSQPRLVDAVQALVKYLTQYRTNLITQIQTTSPHPDEFSEPSDAAGSLESKIIDVTLIDTTLVRCYLLVNHAMIGPLLRIKNYVNVSVVDSLLGNSHKYRELIDLYHSKGLHRKALQLLKRLGHQNSGESYGLGGVAPTIQYLERLGGDHFDLIREFVTWCLTEDSESSMILFTEDHATAASLPAHGVLDLLESFDPNLAKQYLHSLLPAHYVNRTPRTPHPCESSVTAQFHTSLALLYLDELHRELKAIATSDPSTTALQLEKAAYSVKPRGNDSNPTKDPCNPNDMDEKNSTTENSSNENPSPPSGSNPSSESDPKEPVTHSTNGESDPIDEKLLEQGATFITSLRTMNQFLVAEPALYKPETLLGRFPTDMFFKPRALVLSHLHRHDQALKLLVHRLGDTDGAEDYCRRVQTRAVFQTLLEVYLNSEGVNPSDHLPAALQLLTRHGAQIEASSALDLLPPSVSMHTLGNFLTPNLRGLLSTSHSAHLTLALLRAERARLNQRLVQLKADPLLLEPTTLCPVCLKRIGTAAFAIFPDRRIVHYSCQTSS